MLTRSVAGVRGIWGESLIPTVAAEYAAAFGMYLNGGKVVLGRDTRTSGEALKYAAIAGLLAFNCEVLDIDVVPTPTAQLAVEKFHGSGGLIITASHNPDQWNGLKFVDSKGQFLDEKRFGELMEIIDSHKIHYRPLTNANRFIQIRELNDRAIQLHIDDICGIIDVHRIQSKKFKVVLDACNGAGSRLLLPLLRRLGADIIELNCLENGIFPRGAEPMPENLAELIKIVIAEKANIGFAVDPDADRLSIVSEKGIALGEEMTLPLVADHIVSQEKGVIGTNLSTSMAIDFVAARHRTKVIRTKIGEANVVSGMKEHQCIIGGEGNGGIIYPRIHYARDTGVGIGILLDYLARSEKTISQLAEAIPSYYLVKRKLDCSDAIIEKALNQLKKTYATDKIDSRDGVKISWDDSWLHLRKSGTEGLLRIFAEETTLRKAQQLVEDAMNTVKSFTN